MKFFIALASLLLVSTASAQGQHTSRSLMLSHQQEIDNEVQKGSMNNDNGGYSHGLTLECDYAMVRHYWGEMYTCLVRNLVTRHYYDYIVNATGDHMTGKGDEDVRAIYILGQRTPFIPYNLTTPFGRKVVALRVESSGVRFVNRTFSYEGDLEYMHFENNFIEEVPIWALRNMTELKWLSFRNNRIRYLEGQLLYGMTKLRRFSVSNNRIEVIPSGLFFKNTELEEIYFYNNRIRMVGWKLVNYIRGLKVAAFMGNPCTEISIYDGVNTVQRLTAEFKTKCAVDCRKAEAAAKIQKEELKFELMSTKTCMEMGKNNIQDHSLLGIHQSNHMRQQNDSSDSDERHN